MYVYVRFLFKILLRKSYLRLIFKKCLCPTRCQINQLKKSYLYGSHYMTFIVVYKDHYQRLSKFLPDNFRKMLHPTCAFDQKKVSFLPLTTGGPQLRDRDFVESGVFKKLLPWGSRKRMELLTLMKLVKICRPIVYRTIIDFSMLLDT